MPQRFFEITNMIAFGAWIALVLLPGRKFVSHLLCATLIPGLLASSYAAVIGWKLCENGPPPRDVMTIEGLRGVFSDDWVFAAAWVHYLVFDMAVGAWIVRDAVRLGIPWPLRTLSLVLTFLAGPIGFLVHLATRLALHRTIRVAVPVVATITALVSGVGHAADAEQFAKVAARVRMAMAQRDLATSAEALGRLDALAADGEDRATAERLAAIQERLEEFWKSVHDGGRKLKGTEEVMIGKAHVAIIEYDATARRLVLRVSGQMKRYTAADMPLPVAATLSNLAVRTGSPASDELLGAIHAMDADGDRAIARRHWTDARHGGAPVAMLLPELDVAAPAAARVKLPAVTPAAEAVLDPRQWLFQVPAGDGWRRLPLGDRATITPQRRIEVTAPADAPVVWLTLGRKLPPMFAFKIYVLSLPTGQACGIFTGGRGGETPLAAAVRLPDDAVEVEFCRQAGAIRCRVNGEDCPVEISDDTAARAPGLFAISLPGGSRVTLAGFEVVSPAKPSR